MNPVILNNFMSDDECDNLINFIDSNLDTFYTGKYKLTHRLLYGIDKYHNNSNPNLEKIDSIEHIVRKYFDKTIKYIKEVMNETDDIYVSSFWLAKQIEGGFLDRHSDTDMNKNMQFDYSCGIYLNDVNIDGTLDFPKLGYSYKPSKGDMVYWPSKDPLYEHEVVKITDTRYTMLMWLTKDPAFDLLKES